MMKRMLIPVLLSISVSLLYYSCGKESELGGCSVSCGGFGQPFRQTNYRFVTEDECRELGEERGSNSCKASYCPPTGDDNDCYQVWP